MGIELWQAILVAILGPGATMAAIQAYSKRMELRAASRKVNADSSATMLDAQGRENERLSTRNDKLEQRIGVLERLVTDASERADRAEDLAKALTESMHRWSVWAGEVREIASHHDLPLPPPPISPIQDAGATT